MNSLSLLATLIQNGTNDDSGMAIGITIIAIIIVLVCLALYIASIVWVYRDAQRRGKNGVLVALLVALISWPMGLLVWLLIRKNV